MSYSTSRCQQRTAMDRYRNGEEGEALVVAGLSADTGRRRIGIFAVKVTRGGHRVGISIRRLAGVSGLGWKTITAIVSCNSRMRD